MSMEVTPQQIKITPAGWKLATALLCEQGVFSHLLFSVA